MPRVPQPPAGPQSAAPTPPQQRAVRSQLFASAMPRGTDTRRAGPRTWRLRREPPSQCRNCVPRCVSQPRGQYAITASPPSIFFACGRLQGRGVCGVPSGPARPPRTFSPCVVVVCRPPLSPRSPPASSVHSPALGPSLVSSSCTGKSSNGRARGLARPVAAEGTPWSSSRVSTHALASDSCRRIKRGNWPRRAQHPS